MDLYNQSQSTTTKNRKDKVVQADIRELCEKKIKIKIKIKKAIEKVYKYIAHFWYQAGISFNLIKLESFQDMLREIGHFGKHLKAPSYHDIRVEYINELMKPLKDQWASFGCSLMSDKEKKIYWTPCAAHCIDLMLEDIGKLPNIKKTIQQAISLVGFIYSHSSTLSMLRFFTGVRELVRHAITRFATSYLSLERIHQEKTNLRKMFMSEEWNENKLAKEAKGKEATKTVLMPSFWKNVVFIMKVMAPLVKVLRLVDSEKKPAMGYICEAMDKAKETIMKSFKNESKYKDVFAIIDKRWDIQLHHPLHAFGHFLNLEFFYANPQMEFNGEIIRGLYDCINKLLGDLEMEKIVHKELAHYKAASGMFGSTTTIAMRGKVAPAQWWQMYGLDTPYLQQLAIRILSLTCSASRYERNWSIFEQVHTKRRNRLEHKRLHDLVFVKYNQALHQRYNLKDEINPISFNGIDDCNEWLIREMDGEKGEDERVHERDDDLTWRQFY
uniref:HAT C-terminal dimerisation domain-containing protein n=2 Tax=Cajanus cajan TaxID=3821 RepID=A0A151RIT0_CAJCA|nr:hypothetical protein KK1_036105 [Cajanus cajan]